MWRRLSARARVFSSCHFQAPSLTAVETPCFKVLQGSGRKSSVRVFREETCCFSCQRGPRSSPKWHGPATLPTEGGLGMALELSAGGGTYRRAARQAAARRRGRKVGPWMSAMRLRRPFGASCSRRCQCGGEEAWEWPGALRHGMRRRMSMIRACVSCAGVPMYRGGRYAGSCVVCMWSMSLCCSSRVYESIVLASSTVSVGVSVFRTRFNVHALQELMARAPCKRRHNPVGPP